MPWSALEETAAARAMTSPMETPRVRRPQVGRASMGSEPRANARKAEMDRTRNRSCPGWARARE
eukprot:7402342-Alexandrium_andersonii.AAC.1